MQEPPSIPAGINDDTAEHYEIAFDNTSKLNGVTPNTLFSGS
jgi:hypothetical protein